MIDRHGKRTYVGWSAHEMIWLEAAITLAVGRRGSAYQDIAAMTGRTFASVQARACKLRVQNRAGKKSDQPILVPSRLPVVWSKVTSYRALGPSQINPPSRARLMGCR